jgi:RNA polymerase sigma-70 factor (ECF subfamily)
MDTWQPERFEELYERFFTPVFRYVLLRVKNRAEAEDLAQTVFMKAYQANPPGKGGQELSLNYFFTVARNTVIDHWRKKKDVIVDDPDEAFENIPDTETPEGDAMRGEANTAVREALQLLSASEQEVLILKFMNELTTKEIAKMLNKTEVAVRQLQSRGLKALRGHLNQEEI